MAAVIKVAVRTLALPLLAAGAEPAAPLPTAYPLACSYSSHAEGLDYAEAYAVERPASADAGNAAE